MPEQPDDMFYVNAVRNALNRGNEDLNVKMTYGELFLYHCLLQNHGIHYTGEERFIPLMERNAARIKNAG